MGSRQIRARHRDAAVPVSQVHRRPAVAGPDVVRVHGGVAQLHIHGHQYDQSDIGGKGNENEGSHDAHGLGQLVAHVRLVPEEFRRVDRSAIDIGVLHHVQMAVGRRVPVFRPDRAHDYTDPVRDRRYIVLLFDIRLFQERYVFGYSPAPRLPANYTCITTINRCQTAMLVYIVGWANKK